MVESVEKGGSRESNNTVENRKLETEEFQDTHATMIALNCGKEPHLRRKSSCEEEMIYWEEILNRTFRNINAEIGMRMQENLKTKGYL
jgi:hypothetical protein